MKQGYERRNHGQSVASTTADLIDGVNLAIAVGAADPDNIAIAGGSDNGHTTSIGVSLTH